MGSKNSVKSKTEHLGKIETRSMNGLNINWEGNGIYVFNKTSETYNKINDLKELEYKIVSDNYGAPTFVRLNQFNELTYWKGG
jgi:hypothetical protein